MGNNQIYFKYSRFFLLSIFLDEYNIFAVPMLVVFIDRYFSLSSLQIGLVTGATILGVALGSLSGGIITDRFGRKNGYKINMVLFIISAFISALSPSAGIFIVSRLIAGIPAGSDISNTYAYIMELIPPGKREITGANNTLMASLAILGINFSVIPMIIMHLNTGMIWKVSMLISVIPAFILLVFSVKMNESEFWKNSGHQKITYTKIIKNLMGNPVMKRTTIYAWSCGIASSIEVGTFAFFIPYIINTLDISGILFTRLIIILIYSFGVPVGYIGPLLIPKIGLKKLSYTGFIISFVSLIGSGTFLVLRQFLLIPAFMVLFVIGNHLNNQPVITSQSLVSNTEYRGRAVGLTNFILQLPSSMIITVFPLMFSRIGLGYSTLVIAFASFAGIIISAAIFKDIYGYSSDLENHGNAKNDIN
ncbi:MFS transporter [Acidiplasma sp.]|uniref:MFS transporter n=1 Tax=Acidiplasma sp. TaxID=1872114 RepID=UPI00281526B6|nr:MFS transporter [Acidiplasma sp.]WMT55463.1 MAG: MFS transporter [Acidiplasma sp.]